MLFYSVEFIFIFLPLFFLIFLVLHKTNYILPLIIISSLIFYAIWDYRFLSLLFLSISINYLLLIKINKNKLALTLGILINLLILFFFKYTNFFLNEVLQTDINYLKKIILPLGISFFTFQQISCLIDGYNNKIKLYGFYKYLAYVSFFPQLIAGPIVRYNEVIEQFNIIEKVKKLNWENINLGLILFIIGIFKKVFFANNFGNVVDNYFLQIANGNFYNALHYWYLIYNFALQIYFDFSAYSDMALGLGLIIGINLPINFNSPFKSLNIIDFWRSWHISLSFFFRDYLYIALGGNKNKFYFKFILIIFVMTIAGLWHGANWTFLIWGLIHGIYVCLTHIILKLNKKYFIDLSGKIKFFFIFKIIILILFFVFLFLFIYIILNFLFINIIINNNNFFNNKFLYIFSILLLFYIFYINFRKENFLNLPFNFFAIFLNFTIVAYLFIIFRSNSIDEAFLITSSLLSFTDFDITGFIADKFWFKFITYNFELLIFILGLIVIFCCPNSNQFLKIYKDNTMLRKPFNVFFNISLGSLFGLSIILIIKSKNIEPFIYFIF